MNNIYIGSNVMDIIERFEFDGKLSQQGKKDLGLYLELALVEWIETYEIVHKIKDIDVIITWKEESNE